MNDFDIEAAMGKLLRAGVIASAMIVLAGALLYLADHASDIADHHRFRGEPAALTHPDEILTQGLRLQSDSIIQLGLVLLILTPVARIVFAIIGFLLEKDFLYVCIGLVVLSIILLSYFGQLGG